MESIFLQLMGLILFLVALLAFVLRKWITASIDARFRKAVESELVRVRHSLSVDAETIKAELAKDLENHKRQIGESGRLEAYVNDKKLALYETFHAEFGELFVRLNAFSHLSDSIYAEPETARQQMLVLLNLAQEARVAVDKHAMYISADTKIRLARLFHGVIKCLADLPLKAEVVHKLTDEYGELSVALDPTRGIGGKPRPPL